MDYLDAFNVIWSFVFFVLLSGLPFCWQVLWSLAERWLVCESVC